MIAIDFEEAEKVKERFNVLGNEAEGVVSLSKSIDPSGVSSFSPGTVASDDEIKATVNNIKNYISTYHSNYATCIDMYKKVYDAIGVGLGRISEMMNYEQLNLSSEYTILGPTEDGKMLRVIYKGKECLIANTRINCFDYQKYVMANHLYQAGKGSEAGICLSDCLMLCEYYAMDMLRGTFSSKNTMSQKNKSGDAACTKFDSTISLCNKNAPSDEKAKAEVPIYDYIYNEVSEGRPVVLQVSQKNENDRHFVVITGFDASVKSARDLNPDTMIALDCWDGEVDFLSGHGVEEGGRKLKIHDGFYQVFGAKEKFKDDEVYNEEWLRKKTAYNFTTINNKDEKLEEDYTRKNG